MAAQPPAIARAVVLAGTLDPAAMPDLRRRMQWTLFAISALGSTGYIAAITVGTLVAAEIAGDATLGGVPTAAATLGTATAATLLSGLMLRVGRRAGLLSGLAVGTRSARPSRSWRCWPASIAPPGRQRADRLCERRRQPRPLRRRRPGAAGAEGVGHRHGGVGLDDRCGEPARTSSRRPVPLRSSLGLPELAGAYLLTVGFIGLATLLAFVLLRPEPYALAHPSALAARACGGGRALRPIDAWPVRRCSAALSRWWRARW